MSFYLYRHVFSSESAIEMNSKLLLLLLSYSILTSFVISQPRDVQQERLIGLWKALVTLLSLRYIAKLGMVKYSNGKCRTCVVISVFVISQRLTVFILSFATYGLQLKQ